MPILNRFNDTFYGTFYFVKGSIKTEHNTLRFDWLNSEFLLIFIVVKRYLIFHTVLDVKSKHYKLNVVKLFAVATNRSCSFLKFRKIHRKTSVLGSLFSKVVGLEACNFIKKWFRCHPVNIPKFFKKIFFYKKRPVAAFMSTRMGKEKKSVEQKEKKNLNWKKKNWNVFVLIITEMQIDYNPPFSSYFFQILFLLILAFSFFLFLFHLTNCVSHLLVHAELRVVVQDSCSASYNRNR